MNRNAIGLLGFFIFIVPYSASAETVENKINIKPSIAILDTAIDTSIPAFKNKIVFEACVIQWPSCPNNLSEMEGQGSASIDNIKFLKNKFDHGTQMSSIAIKTNPNMGVVFVRIIGVNRDGSRQVADESTISNALDWVIKNKDRFNIQAVSMSQSYNSPYNGKNYCPETPITESKIKSLIEYEIPVFFPSGNNKQYNKINWPACIAQSISISAVSSNESPASYTNYDPALVDFFSQGSSQALTIGGKNINSYGTSVATVIAASNWIKIKQAKPGLTYYQMYDLIHKTSKPISNLHIKNGKLINVKGAING